MKKRKTIQALKYSPHQLGKRGYLRMRHHMFPAPRFTSGYKARRPQSRCLTARHEIMKEKRKFVVIL
eukprot:827688-Pelagomonas_calceolata.AAC.5